MGNDQNESSLMSGDSPTSLDPVVVALETAVMLGDMAKLYLAKLRTQELGEELRAIDAEWRSQVSEEAKLALGEELRAIDAEWRSQVSEEAKLALGKELRAIDAKWRSQVSEEAKLALGKELRAIDAKWSTEVARQGLNRELRAIDAKWRSQVSKEAIAELARLAEELKRAAERCNKMLGGYSYRIGEQTTPSTDVIGVVAQSVMYANTQSLTI